MDIEREEKTIKKKYKRINITEPLDFNSYSSNLDEKQQWCNILSIDGGDIRGSIPAIWLMELERQIRRPISSIFDVIAGTSTEYFGSATLSDAKSELVIPAVKSGGSVTDIFTRFNSHQDSTKNFCLTDILMCTTAAPTYFPAYQFNSSVYVDGGVQANIPAMIAYDHASKSYPHYDRNRVRLLSLGTGDYVPDPLNLNANRNLLFWARNHQSVFKILMDGPQNNIDLHLNSVLGDNYYRWQIWLENPIDLDDIQDKSINRLIDLAHGHLEEMEAYDNRHRLGCLIEKFRS
ncbi:unnamed protein product [Rotaria sp. Silwood1]|nr:unnamed protein product [Rotaria sp. Silwood1]CAF4552771.1 unnamed protein product [Rotaria sp. Silwood1]